MFGIRREASDAVELVGAQVGQLAPVSELGELLIDVAARTDASGLVSRGVSVVDGGFDYFVGEPLI